MRLLEMSMKHFLVHKNRQVKFPRTGPVVITGENGSGKSTFIHAVTWALYGKVVANSGNLALAPKVEGDVTLVTDTLKVHRGKKLTWNLTESSPTDWKTITIANEQLAENLPTLETWYRTHVMTSDDVGFFTGSTDKQRKEFMEELLGVTELDAPYVLAKADYDDALSQVETAQREVEKIKAVIEAYEAQVDLAEKVAEPTSAERDAVKVLHTELKARTEVELKPLVDKASEVKAHLSIHKEWLETMGGGSCPTCKQAIDPSVLDDTARKKAKHEKALASLQEKIVQVKVALQEAQLAWRQAQDHLQERTEAWQDWHRQRKLHDQNAEKVKALKGKLDTIQRSVESVDIDLYRDCKQALSPMGVRSWVIGQTLDKITDLANVYLTKLSPNLQVELRGYTELKNGGTNDAISLKVSEGGGKFWTVSQGQRQRVSLAVRLAVASIRKGDGTLFLDECFSNLDTRGVDGAVALLHELAESRCIVVITHDKRLARALRTTSENHISL